MSINNISDLDLGTFLQIIYSKGIYHQTSRDYSDFDMIKMHNVKVAPGRQYDFQLSTSLAPASTQRRNPGVSDRAFPKGFKIAHEEYSAFFKEIQTTIEVNGNLLARASETPEKYAELWATQAELSLDGSRRTMASEIYRDGTGALGHVASAAASNANNQIRRTFTLNNDRSTTNKISYAGWFETDDILILKERDGTASLVNITNGGQTLTYWQVVEIDELANTVLCKGLDADFAPVVEAGATLTQEPVADEVFYRYDQQIFPDIDSVTDYGSVSTPIVGYESLAANDGRTVHGMDLEGALAGSQIDAGGASIDVKFIEKAMNKAKRRVGPNRYDWKKMCTSYQTRSALIESKEADRRFVAVTDNTRGSAEFNYVHGETQLRLGASEYCPEDAIWMLPEVRSSGDKVMEYVGDEMKVAKYGNMADFHLKANSGQYVDTVQQFMRGVNLLLCKHPAAIASIINFKNQ